jgi:hypothetical protein
LNSHRFCFFFVSKRQNEVKLQEKGWKKTLVYQELSTQTVTRPEGPDGDFAKMVFIDPSQRERKARKLVHSTVVTPLAAPATKLAQTCAVVVCPDRRGSLTAGLHTEVPLAR